MPETHLLHAFLQAVTRLNSSQESDDLLAAALDLADAALALEGSSTPAISLALLPIDDGLRCVRARGVEEPAPALTFEPPPAWLEKALRNGAVERIEEPSPVPDALSACSVVLILPLALTGDQRAALLFGDTRRGAVDTSSLRLLAAVQQGMNAVLANVFRLQDLRNEKERITEVQEEARKKLARDLHDGPTQTMAAITMRINYAKRLVERDPVEAVEELRRVEEMARGTTREIRHMLFTLRPLILETQGLVAALYQLADKVYTTHHRDVIVEAEQEPVVDLDLGKQSVIFYIAEEAVNNARKHAEPEHIWVRLRHENGAIVLQVEDDGVGFNVGAVDADYAQRGSLGIVNMRERSELVGGTLRIDSVEGAGTRVTLTVPFDKRPEGQERA